MGERTVAVPRASTEEDEGLQQDIRATSNRRRRITEYDGDTGPNLLCQGVIATREEIERGMSTADLLAGTTLGQQRSFLPPVVTAKNHCSLLYSVPPAVRAEVAILRRTAFGTRVPELFPLWTSRFRDLSFVAVAVSDYEHLLHLRAPPTSGSNKPGRC